MPDTLTAAADPLIHIGFHKTATTYLQKSVFSNTTVFQQPWGAQSGLAIEHFVLCHPEQFDPEEVRRALFEVCTPEAGTVPVVSHEGLSGNPMTGRYDMDRVAGRIKASFPQARILIGIREQNAIIASNYYQYVRQGGTKTLMDILSTNRQGPGYRPVVRLDHFEYDLTIAPYQRLFSPQNVLVLPIELLRRAPGAYFGRLRAFIGTDQEFPMPEKVLNARRSKASMRVERTLNKIIPVPEIRAQRYADNPLSFRLKNRALRLVDSFLARNPKWGSTADGALKAEIEDFVTDHYRASNRRVVEQTGLDLEALGYKL